MNGFWNILGERYCAENGYMKILKADDIEEGKQLHEDTLCIVNHDNSGSMFSPETKYNNAVSGA